LHQTSSRRAVAATIAFLAFLGAPGCGPEAPPPPNIVLISIDTLRYDYLGTTGAPEGVSPAIDRLAREGAVFSRAYSTTSWTLPSHLSLLTGQYPASHGVTTDNQLLAPEKETMAEFLQERGYRTGGFWAGPYLHPAWGFAQGFEEYGECVNYRMEVNEEGHVRNTGHANMRSRSGVTGPNTHEHAAAWLRTIPEGDPYFLFVHYWDPHTDYEAPAPYDRWLDPDSGSRITGRGIMLDKRVHPDMTDGDRKRLHDLYRGEIRWTDTWIRELIREIQARGEWERTLVILVSDHGEEFFEHGRHGHRLDLYDETVRVPMIARLPGDFAAGSVVDAPASLIDGFPTVAAIVAGDADPRRAEPEVQGVDLRSLMTTHPTPRLLYQALHDELRVVRTEDWKLIRNLETGDAELYRVAQDPGEQRNLAAGAEAALAGADSSSAAAAGHPDAPATLRTLTAALEAGSDARFAADRPADAPAIDPETEAELRALGYTE
jgi:arylsulfatase A-like enzyme